MNPSSAVERPIFILSSGRCGSTLLQRLLNAADGVAIAGEHYGFLQHIAAAYFPLEARIAQSGATPDELFEQAAGQLSDPTHWSAWTNWLHRDTLQGAFAGLIRRVIAPPESGDNCRWGFKEVRYAAGDRVAELLLQLFPAADLIVLARHPIATIASMRQVNWQDGAPVEQLAREWNDMYVHFAGLAAGHPERVTLVRFEHLIDTTCSALDDLFGRLGLPFDDRCREILTLREGRLSSVCRDRGVDPVSLLTMDQRRDIYRLTREGRRAIGYDWDATLTLNHDCQIAESAGGGTLQQGDGRSRRLNEQAAWILRRCQAGASLAVIVDELRRACPNDSDPVADSANEFVEQLLAEGVLHVEPELYTSYTSR